ncbi:hypothetical protein Leryth_017973 [Lithospermum erythrorhizon]|nr:hypothetical protein Leryth_017973 [Lithospermum erythrorhizon]
MLIIFSPSCLYVNFGRKRCGSSGGRGGRGRGWFGGRGGFGGRDSGSAMKVEEAEEVRKEVVVEDEAEGEFRQAKMEIVSAGKAAYQFLLGVSSAESPSSAEDSTRESSGLQSAWFPNIIPICAKASSSNVQSADDVELRPQHHPDSEAPLRQTISASFLDIRLVMPAMILLESNSSGLDPRTCKLELDAPVAIFCLVFFLLTQLSASQLAFWDYMEKKQLGTTKAECSVTSEWSPDGRYFMTATTAPRFQVDNGVKIFYHNGNLYFKQMFGKLFQADWKPESPEMFGDVEEFVKSVD